MPPVETPDQRHRDALKSATAQFRSKNFDACAETLKALIAVDPAIAEAHNLRGFLFQATGDLDAAIDSFRRTIALQPDAPGAYNNLAAILTQSGRLEDAVNAYDDALRLAPSAVAIHYNKATALAAHNRISEAIDALNDVLRLDPSYRDADQRLAMILSRIEGSSYLPRIDVALTRCFASPRIDYLSLARLAARQLALKYQLDHGFDC
jgi:tetratricopeptide (TPR) repeat protein